MPVELRISHPLSKLLLALSWPQLPGSWEVLNTDRDKFVICDTTEVWDRADTAFVNTINLSPKNSSYFVPTASSEQLLRQAGSPETPQTIPSSR